MSVDIPHVKRKVVTGVISYGVRTLALQGIAFVATVLLGYYLSPADFGVYYIVVSVISLFSFLSDIGLAAALIQKKDELTVEELRTTFTVQQLLACGIFLALILLTPFWRANYGFTNESLFLLFALGFSFPLASLKTIPSILLERKLEFGKLVIPQLFENIAFYGIAVVLAAKGFGVGSYTYAVIARSVVGVVSIYFLQRWPIGFALAKNTLKRLLHFGVKFQLNDLLARIKDNLFIVILARFISTTQMGYISWAKRWSLFPFQLSVNSVISVTFSTYARLQDQEEYLRKAIEKSLYFISLLIFPVLVGMSVLANPLIHLVPKYLKWEPALFSLYFFCIDIAWSSVSTPLTNILNAIGQIDKTLKLMLLWTGLTWFVTPIGVILFGYNGVAIATAAIAFSSVLTGILVKRVIKVSLFAQVWRAIVASGMMGVVVFVFTRMMPVTVVNVGLAVVIGALAYVGASLLIGYRKLQAEVGSFLRH